MKVNLLTNLKNFQYSIGKYSPEIFTGLGIAGMITSTIMAVKATPKALTIIETEEQKRELLVVDSLPPEIKKKDIIKLTWKCYIPSMLFCLSSVACLIGASTVNLKRKTALATAYTLSETAFNEYRKKVIETVNEKKEAEIQNEIQKDKIKNNPPEKSTIYLTEKGNTLCYDSLSGRYFNSSIETIKAAVNEINHRLLSEMYISLNELYEELGLERTSIGNDLGWNVDGELIKPYFGSHLTKNDQPCIVVEYNTCPKYNYSNGL